MSNEKLCAYCETPVDEEGNCFTPSCENFFQLEDDDFKELDFNESGDREYNREDFVTEAQFTEEQWESEEDEQGEGS